VRYSENLENLVVKTINKC